MGSPRRGLVGLNDDLVELIAFLRERAPVYVRLLEILRDLLLPRADPARLSEAAVDSDARAETAAARLALAWSEREFHAFYGRPLLLLAAMRNDALEHPGHPLAAALAPGDLEPDIRAVTRDAARDALAAERTSLWRDLRERSVQTNEPSRAVAWRWPALIAGCDARARPLALVDVGASAGLNLSADAHPALWVDGDGAPLPVASSVDAHARVGLDARPLDPFDPRDARWLRACVWPGQRARLSMMETALRAARAAARGTTPPQLRSCDASRFISEIRAVERALAPGGLLLVYQTVVRDYLPPRIREALAIDTTRWLAGLPPGRAVWVELEAASVASDWPADLPAGFPATLTARVRAGDRVRSLVLARCDFAPRVVEDDAEAVSALAGATRCR